MEPPNGPALRVRSLRKVYGDVVAVDDVSFEVERGSVFCMIGPNGAGKTTTIECLEGLRRPDAGSILVAGLDPTAEHAQLVRKIGVQLQETGIPPRMKASEALWALRGPVPKIHSIARAQRRVGIRRVPFQALRLPLRRPEAASQHRARACGRSRDRIPGRTYHRPRPRVPIPILELPPAAERTWYDDRRDTHYMEEAREYCDTVLLMNQGRVVTSGAPERLIQESGLAARVVLSTARLGALRADDLSALPSVIHVRTTQSDFYLYGDGDMVDDVTTFLRREGVSAGVMQTRPANLDDIYFLAVGNENPLGVQA